MRVSKLQWGVFPVADVGILLIHAWSKFIGCLLGGLVNLCKVNWDLGAMVDFGRGRILVEQFGVLVSWDTLGRKSLGKVGDLFLELVQSDLE